MTDTVGATHWSTMTAVGVGELLWDLLPTGPRLGGAPFNAIAHLRRLGLTSRYITAVGSDELGRVARDEVRRLGVDDSLIQVVDLPTGIVRVQVDSDGNPEYEIVSPAAYEAVEPIPDSEIATCGDTDILIFGTLAQRFGGMKAVTRAIAQAAPAALRLYDVNLRDGCWSTSLVEDLLGLATLAKLNDTERGVLARDLDLPMDSIEQFARVAVDRFGLRGVCVTRGTDGASLLLDDVYLETRAVPVSVADTIGAGDAFSAGLAAGVAAGWSAADALALASRLAAIVVSREGAIPDWDLAELGVNQG